MVRWFGSPVTSHTGSLPEIARFIPAFERRTFGLLQHTADRSRLNERLDMIVRMPVVGDDSFVPVGIVSKEYRLVQHLDVLGVVATALCRVGLDVDDLEVELKLSEYGERMHLSIRLPAFLGFTVSDGDSMALTIECFNSVDGSTRFRVLMGWFRFVCANGLTIGVTQHDIRRRHVGEMGIEDVGEVIAAGIQEARNDRRNFEEWLRIPVSHRDIVGWIDKDVRKEWGYKAAARVYHICRTGYDAKVLGPYRGNSPTSVPVKRTIRVPGAPPTLSNLFELSQVLSWIARTRTDVQEQLMWRESIRDLMEPLTPR